MTDLFDPPFEDEDDQPEQSPGSRRLADGRRLAADDGGLPTARRILTVTELTVRVRDLLEREFFEVWVEGELSNCRVWHTGHLYFTLKDQGAQISVVVFRSSARLLRFRPADGMQVVVRGRVTIYEDRGQLQIIAEYVEPKGAGALQIAFEQLKAKLQAEGLFDAARKKAIPALPRRIGIVTSPQAAAVRDILNILRRRHHTVSVLIFPAQVQGEAAAGEVGAGVRYFNRARNVDVIIVARGGGSADSASSPANTDSWRVGPPLTGGRIGKRVRNADKLSRSRTRCRHARERLSLRPVGQRPHVARPYLKGVRGAEAIGQDRCPHRERLARRDEGQERVEEAGQSPDLKDPCLSVVVVVIVCVNPKGECPPDDIEDDLGCTERAVREDILIGARDPPPAPRAQ